jgi:hypothetical protein
VEESLVGPEGTVRSVLELTRRVHLISELNQK